MIVTKRNYMVYNLKEEQIQKHCEECKEFQKKTGMKAACEVCDFYKECGKDENK